MRIRRVVQPIRGQDNVPPATPTPDPVTSVATSGSTISVDWNDNVEPDLDHYNVYLSTDDAIFILWDSPTVSTSTLTGLASSTTYFIQVSAVDTVGNESPRTTSLVEATDIINPGSLTVALAGCSQTRAWVGDRSFFQDGYRQLFSDTVFTPTTSNGFDFQDLLAWVDPQGTPMTNFAAGVTGNEDFILLQVCTSSGSGAVYADLLTVIGNLQAVVPDAPVYLMPIEVDNDSTGGCLVADYENSIAFIAQAVTNGDALQGPHVLPLLDPTEVDPPDLCHPNQSGITRICTDHVHPWVLTLTPSTSGDPYDLTLGGTRTVPGLVAHVQWATAPTPTNTYVVTLGDFADLQAALAMSDTRITIPGPATYSGTGTITLSGSNNIIDMADTAELNMGGLGGGGASRLNISGSVNRWNGGDIFDTEIWHSGPFGSGTDMLFDGIRNRLWSSGMQNDWSRMQRWQAINSTFQCANNAVWPGVHMSGTSGVDWYPDMIFANCLCYSAVSGNGVVRWSFLTGSIMVDSYVRADHFGESWRFGGEDFWMADTIVAGSGVGASPPLANAIIERGARYVDSGQGWFQGPFMNGISNVTINDMLCYSPAGTPGQEASLAAGATGSGNLIQSFSGQAADLPSMATYGRGFIT